MKCSTRLLFLLLLLSTSFANAKQYQLSICTMFQDEGPYLKEWIEFHKLVGVEHFWVYNNNSTDNYKEILAPYIKDGTVELIEWPSKRNDVDDFTNHTFRVQTGAFNDALKRARSKTKWLAIIDLDEFLFSPVKDNIVQVLDQYFDEVAGVCVNWQLYGTSFVPSIGPNELMTEKLTLKAEVKHPRNRYYKSIVKPKYVRRCGNPHYCSYKKGFFHVDTNGNRIEVKANHVLIDKLRINHYWVRDEYFLHHVKLPRYMRWLTKPGEDPQIVADGILSQASHLNALHDGAILRFMPKLKKAMQKKKS